LWSLRLAQFGGPVYKNEHTITNIKSLQDLRGGLGLISTMDPGKIPLDTHPPISGAAPGLAESPATVTHLSGGSATGLRAPHSALNSEPGWALR
jgi:hypothetical protein